MKTVISASGDATSAVNAEDTSGGRSDLRAKFFRGLGDESRILILDALCATELSVGEIVERTKLSQSNVSNHLRCLGECGLVTCKREGRFARYRISDPRVVGLLQAADALLSAVATGVEACGRYSDAPE